MPFNEALFWFGLTAFGTGLYFLFEATVKRLYSIGVTVIGALACAYAEYRHYHPEIPAIHLWVILLILTWALLGYNIYVRRFRPSAPKTVEVDLVPWQGKGDKMFLTVTNRGAEQEAFQGQCRILGRRNDINATQLITFDLQWEYGGQSYCLLPGQSGNLLIASSDYTEHHDWAWLQLEAAVGSTKPQRSDWAHGDKLPEYDVEVTILGGKSSEPHRQKFTVRAGKDCAIEMEELSAVRALAARELAQPAKQALEFASFVPLQKDALRLSVELVDFLKGLGSPPAPKYSAKDIDNMTSAQMKDLIDAEDGDFAEACEYYKGDGVLFIQTANAYSNKINRTLETVASLVSESRSQLCSRI